MKAVKITTEYIEANGNTFALSKITNAQSINGDTIELTINDGQKITFRESAPLHINGSIFAGNADAKVKHIRSTYSSFFVEAPGSGGVDYMSVRKVANPKIILFGTSQEAYNGTGVETLDVTDYNTAACANGWFNWFQHYSGQRSLLTRNAGVGGNTSAQMLARIETDVMAFQADWVFIGGPVNDPYTDVPSATTIDNLKKIYARILGSGRRILQLTMAPRVEYNSPSRIQSVIDIENWMMSQHGKNGVIVVPIRTMLADAGGFAPATGMAYDNVHYSVAAAQRIGQKVAQYFSGEFANESSNAPQRLSIIANPAFVSGTGWTVNKEQNGTTPVPVYEPGRASFSIAGNTNSGITNITFLENISGSRFAIGDVVQAECIMEYKNFVPLAISAVTRPTIQIRLQNAANSVYKTSHNLGGTVASVANQPLLPSGEILVKTTPITISDATTNRLYVYIGFFAAAAVDIVIRNLKVYKIN